MRWPIIRGVESGQFWASRELSHILARFQIEVIYALPDAQRHSVPRRLQAPHRRDGERRPDTNGSRFFIMHSDYPLQPTTSSSRA
ncbi:MAG TPA: hypothetical protein VFV95_08670 [Vicinamibacterales bacterium]|nr:hypothetical protein [Vicinamibacterales bacterium]